MDENIARVEAPRPRGRGAGRDRSSCRPSCSRARTSAARSATRYFAWAKPAEGHPTIARFSALAKELGVVIPVSFFEKAGHAYYNSLAMVDADGERPRRLSQEPHPRRPRLRGEVLLPARRHRLPSSWNARPAHLGVGICWDQWFPESARAMMLDGRRGPALPDRDRQRAGEPGARHARPLAARDARPRRVATSCPWSPPTASANEGGQVFYGSSFIADQRGEKLAELGRDDEGVAVATIDLAQVRRDRASWGFFRDRRPDLYGRLTT